MKRILKDFTGSIALCDLSYDISRFRFFLPVNSFRCIRPLFSHEVQPLVFLKGDSHRCDSLRALSDSLC